MIFNGEGYYLNDNTASGGVKEEERVLPCGHCPTPLLQSRWKKWGGHCMVCDKPLCGPCLEKARTFGCTPTEQKFLNAVNDAYRREQNLKVLGIG